MRKHHQLGAWLPSSLPDCDVVHQPEVQRDVGNPLQTVEAHEDGAEAAILSARRPHFQLYMVPARPIKHTMKTTGKSLAGMNKPSGSCPLARTTLLTLALFLLCQYHTAVTRTSSKAMPMASGIQK